MKRVIAILMAGLLAGSQFAQADDVEILNVYLQETSNSWNAEVTLKHADTGWEHYADAWRVVDESGHLIKTRVLYHPHVNEQPFTRSLGNIQIPSGTSVVYVEAHDKVHGWSKQRIKIDLSRSSGERYHVRRK